MASPRAIAIGGSGGFDDGLGYRDYIGALQNFRVGTRSRSSCWRCPPSSGLPFADRLYPNALAVLKRLRARARPY